MIYLLENIEAIKYMKRLKKDKIIFDAIITDPPYNISRDNNFHTINRAGIKFGTWDYKFDQKKWIKYANPLIKNGGSIIIFNDYKNMGNICDALVKNNFEIKDLLRWKKNNPMPRNVKRRYVSDCEYAIWAVKKGKWTFNKDNDKKYLRPEFNCSIVAKSKNKIHPTQKSVKMLEEIIKIHTNKKDLIFDPFCGSAAIGIAALKLERCYIGTEIDKHYYLKAKTRIENFFNQEIIKNNNVKRSPLYYLGDKYKLIPKIHQFFPKKIDTFYDLFGGGGTLLANINAKQYIYNDIDYNVKNLVQIMKKIDFQKIENNLLKIIKKYDLSYFLTIKKNNQKQYLKLRDDYNNLKNKSNQKAYFMLFVLIIYGFNSQIRFNSKGLFNIPIGKQDLNKNRHQILKTFVNALKSKEIKFYAKPFNKINIKQNLNNDFVYVDPPYSLTNATYNSNWNEKDDQELFDYLDQLDQKKIKWAMSNVLTSGSKKNEKLAKWAKKYHINCIDNFNYNNSNYQKKEKGASEILVTNYAL